MHVSRRLKRASSNPVSWLTGQSYLGLNDRPRSGDVAFPLKILFEMLSSILAP